jgi:hypothetical protein
MWWRARRRRRRGVGRGRRGLRRYNHPCTTLSWF